MRFRLLAGMHIQNDPMSGKERIYRAGAVFESVTDLARRWPEKFERVLDSTPLTPDPAASGMDASPSSAPLPSSGDEYEGMTVKELQALAAEEEIDLKGARTREEILTVLRKATARV